MSETVTYEPHVVQVGPQVTAVVRGRVAVSDIPAFLGGVFREVMQVLAAQGLTATGPPFSRYVPAPEGFDVEAGFPASGTVHPAGRVRAGVLPGGTVARVLYKGDYGGVGGAYDAAMRWTCAHDLVPTDAPWESYLDGPEVAEPRTVVLLPCRHA